MALYVVQHGKSLPKNVDPEKGLSAEGTAETERMGEVAAGYQVPVSKILHSGKKRALETAEILSSILSPEGGIGPQRGMNPMDDAKAFTDHIRLDLDIMLVGHLPFLERLIGQLVCGDPHMTLFKLQNSGIVCIDRVPDVKHPVIRWALMPIIA